MAIAATLYKIPMQSTLTLGISKKPRKKRYTMSTEEIAEKCKILTKIIDRYEDNDIPVKSLSAIAREAGITQGSFSGARPYAELYERAKGLMPEGWLRNQPAPNYRIPTKQELAEKYLAIRLEMERRDRDYWEYRP